ncbi:MAG TPA: HAD family phosphatase [Nanoarchaeota archaeon]|nr:MAG: hypothetical protein QJ16_C0017G0016 [archaeon GW2011_AR1]HIH52349.1 HAD family phosphatase [Nanoarchaeota archaeon]
MIKVIAVDFGGVYFTWNYKKYLLEISKVTNTNPEKVKKALSTQKLLDFHVDKISEKEYWNSFCKKINKKIDHKILKKITLDQSKPIIQVINLIRKLRKNYYIILLANQTKALDDLDRKYHFYKDFDLLLSSHIIKMQKPNKNIFKMMLNKTHLNPSEIIFIDDTKKNIDVAKKIGIHGILFKNFNQLKKEINRIIK